MISSDFSFHTNIPYSELGENALKSTKKKLKKYPNLGPREFNVTYKPINEEISLLASYLSKFTYHDMEKAIKRHSEYTWNCKEVLKCADKWMKTAYTISNLTLDDLALFTKSTQDTYVTSLTRQDSYQHHTFFYCTYAYHFLKSKMFWSEKKEKLMVTIPAPKEYEKAFYKEGTIQYSWNVLYNDYCDRVEKYVCLDELSKSSTKHVKWIKKDTDITTFSFNPDTLSST